MGIGEKAFSERFATQHAALLREVQLAGMVGDTYLNAMLGVAFRLPDGWIVRDLKEIAKTAEGRLLSSENEALNDASRALSERHLPIVTISAPTLDDPVARLGPHELCPVAVLQMEGRIARDDAWSFDLLDLVETDLSYLIDLVEDFTLVAPPARTELSQSEAVTYSAAYTMLHADAGEGCAVRERTYYVRHHEYVLAFRLCDYPELDPRLTFVFDDFVRTIALR